MKSHKIKGFPVRPSNSLSDVMTALTTVLSALCLLSHLYPQASTCSDITASQSCTPSLYQNIPVSAAVCADPSHQACGCLHPRSPQTPSALPSAYPYYDVPLDPALQRHLFDTCEQYNLPVPVMLALMEVESRFDSTAVSPTLDYGLCQINQVNFSWLERQYGLTDMLDPRQNITAGCIILGDALRKNHGDLLLALMSYANGPTGAARLRSQGVTSTKHSLRVLSRALQLQKQNHLS